MKCTHTRYIGCKAVLSTIILCGITVASNAGAATYYVRTDGSNGNSGAGPDAASAWATINHAATSGLSAGDTVYVKSGVYPETVAPTVDGTSGNPIQFIADTSGAVSGWSAGMVTIQAAAAAKCLDIDSDNYLTFRGFTIDGDSGEDAVDIDAGSGVVLERCVIFGGNRGVEVDQNANASIVNCLIRNNGADGVNVISGNATIYNCTIVNNGDDGVDSGNASATVLNSIIADNSDNGFSRQSDGDGTLSHFFNLLYNNADGNYSGTSIGSGEVVADPQFVGGGDYRLQSSSPAVDSGIDLSGTVDDDLVGTARPQGGNYDIGSYEYLAVNTYYVRTDGSDSNAGDGPDAADAWATIDHAASASLNPGDTVYVQTGVYSETVAPTVDGASGNPIQFIADTAGTVAGWSAGKVTIQAPSAAKCLDLDSDDYLTFRGFTLRGDPGNDVVDVDYGAGVRIERCEIYSGNKGVEVDHGAAATVVNCLIRDNSGSGIGVEDGTCTVWNSTIANNGNDGVKLELGTATVTNSIIYGNTADGLDDEVGGITHTYNLVYANGDSNYEGTSTSPGEVSSDPLFVNAFNYRLQAGSPAVDAGTNASGVADDDLGGVSRPQGAAWDLGAFELALVGHWKLDETSGTAAADSSGRGNDGVYTNGVSYGVAGIDNTAASFDGANDYVSIPNDATLEMDDYLTMAAWIFPDSAATTEGMIINKEGEYEVGLTASGELRWAFSNATPGWAWHNTGYFPAKNAWTHIAVTYNSGEIKTFANGVLVETFAGSGTIGDSHSSLNELRIGGRSNNPSGKYFQGRIDEVWIYGRTLSEAEIIELSDNGDGLVAHWKLDEISGTTATDSSPSGLDGTYANGVSLNATGPYPKDGAVAAEFDGTNDRVTLPAVDFNYANGLTISGWMKPSAAPASFAPIVSFTNGPSTDYIWFGWQPGYGVEFFVNNGSSSWVADFDEGTIGAWEHCVVTVDSAGNVKLYRNGVESASGAVTLPTNTERIQNYIGFGNSASLDYFPGSLDDIRVYSRPLEATEVAELYGLVGHWEFDEGAGPTASDDTAFANHANLINGATWTSNCHGANALEVDGAGGIAQTGADFQPPTRGTVAFWMRASGPPATRSRIWGVEGDFETRQESDGTLSFDLLSEGPPDFTTSNDLSTDGRWRHIIAIFDSDDDSFEVYVDGKIEKSGTNGDSMSARDAAILSFGTRTGSTEYWEGGLRDFRIYNRPISAKEIAALSGLVGHWRFDETSGTIAADSTGNGNDGTYANGPTLGVQSQYSPELGTAVDFDGANDFVEIPHSNQMLADEGGVSFWFKANTFPVRQGLFSKDSNGYDGGGHLTIWLVGNTIDVRLQSVTASHSVQSGGLAANKWRHVTATWGGTGMALYMDGIEVDSEPSYTGGLGTSSGGAGNAEPIAVGANAWSSGNGVVTPLIEHFDGAIDDLHFFARPLCAEEVYNGYRDGRSPGIRIKRWVETR